MSALPDLLLAVLAIDLRPDFHPLLSRVHRLFMPLCGQFLQDHFPCIFIGR